MECATGIDHHSELICEFVVIGLLEGLRMWPVVDALGMKRNRSCIDIVAREEVPLVIKEDLIVVDVGMEEWNLQHTF